MLLLGTNLFTSVYLSYLFLTKTKSYESLNERTMSQTLQEECSTKQYKVPELLFTQNIPFDEQKTHYIVVALLQRKQGKTMEEVGQVHCRDQTFLPGISLVMRSPKRCSPNQVASA